LAAVGRKGLGGGAGVADRKADEARVRQWLEQFAASPVCRDLAAAAVVRRDVEFVLDGSDVAPGVTISGRIDLLWQDAAGSWRLIAWDFPPTEAHGSFRAGTGELLVQALACARQSGRWPTTALVYSVPDGVLRDATGTEAEAVDLLRRRLRPDGVTEPAQEAQ